MIGWVNFLNVLYSSLILNYFQSFGAKNKSFYYSLMCKQSIPQDSNQCWDWNS